VPTGNRPPQPQTPARRNAKTFTAPDVGAPREPIDSGYVLKVFDSGEWAHWRGRILPPAGAGQGSDSWNFSWPIRGKKQPPHNCKHAGQAAETADLARNHVWSPGDRPAPAWSMD